MEKHLRSEKFRCDDGSTWCTIWYPSPGDSETGHCFDFRFEDIDEIIEHLQALKTMPTEEDDHDR